MEQVFCKKKILGTFTYSKGERYEGNWANNKKNGEGNLVNNYIGKIVYINGDEYTGNWKNDKKSGKGSFYFS